MSERDLQPDHPLLPFEVEQQIDRISDEFERAWKSGQAPRIEDYLDRVSAVGRPRLLEELLVVEFDTRQGTGETLDIQVYYQRFPGSQSVIATALALHQRRRQEELPRPRRRRDLVAGDSSEEPVATQIGRFAIQRRLGWGGFGVVYLAHDPGLDRLVALKVPRRELLVTGQQRASFLHEARTAAKLKHPALVAVYEVQQEGELIYIVQEYIDGQDLAQWAAAQPHSWEDITRRLIEIATAIGYVHQQGFYHRDLKPTNILIDREGHAHVTDFGLAVHEDAMRMLKGQAAGTPQYMSPEQVRGETHWIDNRTDIWALGVILYELLSGQRPFAAPNRPELLEEIQGRDPKSPRTKNSAIPKELERICFKCLAKRRTHRYANASDLLEDLQAFLAASAASHVARIADPPSASIVEPGSGAPVGAGSTVGPDADSTPRQSTPTPDSGSQPPLRIVPKGLRSFDEDDKDFFLELLPGPRDREGLPDSIRFWKTRIEKRDADATFAVGVMYGPSGCGKSSLVKAGLLPHLAAHVLPIFVEATPSDTELRLLKALRKHVPRVATEASLAEALAQLREGRVTDGQKVLLVLDQFEQWLHAVADMDSSQLVRALRQCDGANVQCLILVRDDFWLSITRFMQALEILQLEGANSAVVDLFDPSHARKVLRAFGFAYGRLPEHDLSADEQRFLDRAAQDLAHDGKVICVQLSLFADMMKGRPWTPASLQEVGGTSGVGVAFLDETFTAKTAPPTHRLHAKAAQAVLKALLPEVGTDIKGQMQLTDRLLECSGYAARPDAFRDLLQILNRELRLVTPTEPEATVQVPESGPQSGPPGSGGAELSVVPIPPEPGGPLSDVTGRVYYQLTHDYLVPSLRDWLTRKQKETRRGRALLRLAERSELWKAKPENRSLPSSWEYLNIRLLTRRSEWTAPQNTMMRHAGKVQGIRWCVALVVLLAVCVASERLRSYVRADRVRNAITAMGNSRGILVPRAIEDLRAFPSRIVAEELERQFNSAENDRKLPMAYALADPDIGRVNRPFLIGAIATASAEECDNIATALVHDRESSLQDLSQAAAAATSQRDWKLKTRLATVALYLNDTRIAADMLQAAPPASANEQPAREPKPAWHDAPLDPSLAPVAETTKAAILAAHGLLEERFAFCLDMSWESFLSLTETLQPSRYRPTRVRPFVHRGQRRVAAVWTRDTQEFRLEYDQTHDQLPSFDTPAMREGLGPADVAAYAGEGGATLYCVLWSQPAVEDEQRCLRVDMREEEWAATCAQMDQAGLRAQTLQAAVSADGTRRYAGIWSNQGESTQANAGLAARELAQANEAQVVWEDVSVAVPGQPPPPLELQRQQLASITALPPEQQDTPVNRLARAKAHYYLDQPHDALADLDVLASQSPPSAEALVYGALCHAQLGKADEAEAALAKLAGLPEGKDCWSPYGQILVQAWRGKVDEVKRDLEELVREDAGNTTKVRYSMTLYNAACVAAQLTRILKESAPAEIAAWERRSLELLRLSYALGHSGSAGIENDPDFAPLYDAPAFQSLAAELTAGRSYAGVWRRSRQRDAWVDSALSLEQQQQAARDRVTEDCRPVAVAVSVLPDQDELRSTMVWHRPVLPPLPEWNPVQRTMFIEHFPTWPGPVEGLADVLRACDDTSLRSGMCLAIGCVKDPSPNAKKSWQKRWAQWHVSQRDSGTHSATGWALRTWDAPPPEVAQRQAPREGFDWELTKTHLTMIRIPAGEVESATNESGLGRGKRIRIRDEFWLSDREVTAGDYLKFLNDKDAEKPSQPEEILLRNRGGPSLPVVDVNWYAAVVMCNWLSRQEGREPCYVKEGKEQIREYDNKIREYDVWKLTPGANGYRLPTADEWEYACRAMTTTVFAFGDNEDLLDRYAVFEKNAKNGPELVGRKLCNTWGLFDMHGNVWEWCQDEDRGGSGRVDRGGGWNDPAGACRAAHLSRILPGVRYNFLGFRVATVSTNR